jgi:ParB-like chromosome segregation protein Spo0J
MAKGNKVQASAANNTAVAAPKTKASKAEFKILQTVEVAPAKLHTGKFLGRSAPHDEATLVERADSIRRNGQQQPIQARAIPGTDEYDVVFGNARTGAGILIVNGYKNGEGKDVKPDPDFKLRVEVVDVDDETAFLCNVVENSQRTQCSPIDNALNQEELRTKYGMSDVMIAKHYGYASSASVSRLKKLLTLEDEYRKNVHDGILTQAAAFLFCDVPEGEPREKVWLKAVDKAGKDEDIGSTEMAAAIKEWRKEEKEAKATAAATGGGDQQQPTGDQQQPTETPAQPEVPAGPGRPAWPNKHDVEGV